MRHFKLLSNVIRHVGMVVSTKANQNKAKLFVASGIVGLTSLYLLWPHGQSAFKAKQKSPELVTFQQPSRENYNFIVNVTRKCTPSVVSIEVKNSQKLNPETGEPMIASTGSGFIIQENGWILTNAHVVMNKPNAIVSVITSNGESYSATVHDIDLRLDLALLKIPGERLPVLPLGSSNDVLTGEWVIALGSPLSLRHTITAGVISSVERDAKELGINSHSMKYIQTDAAITFGHSGGPLVNLDGEVIGVNNLRITAGIAFAIPIDYAKEFLLRSSMHSIPNQSKDGISLQETRFGITTIALSPEVITELMREQNIVVPERTEGILVWKVMTDSPAFKAGLIAGDVITHINNAPVTKASKIYNLISINDKQTLTFTILRRGIKTEVSLKSENKKR